MLKFNRTTEYGLIAMRHLSRRAPGEASSAREIADIYGLPFDITAKTLQRLKETGLIQSSQGARGGYMLARPLAEITLSEFLDLMEGACGVVACAEQDEHEMSCEYQSRCQIHGVMRDLNARLKTFLSSIRLSEFGDELEQPLEPVTIQSSFSKVQS